VAAHALIVFVKEPRPGAVKTRLATVLGNEQAAQLYRALAEEAVRRTRPRGREYEQLLFFTPAEAGPALARWFPGETLLPQKGAELGERMANAFEATFASGARRVAIVGTDAPGLSRQLVNEALLALGDHDVVVGPAQDGGYYLLALDRPRRGLFEAIPWSTSAVLAATAERASLLGLRLSVLEPLTDIDTLEDLRREWPAVRPLLAERPDLIAAVEIALATHP
jgi:uncharacterized protein